MYRPYLTDMTFDIEFSKAREECLELADEACLREQRLLEVEARIYFVRFIALERGNSPDPSQLDKLQQLQSCGQEQLSIARQICTKFPGQTSSLQTELAAVENMLEVGTSLSHLGLVVLPER